MSDVSKRTRDVANNHRGIQPVHIRQANLRAILGIISMQPGISNAELSRITDLAPQTVSSVLADLESRSLITRGEVLRGRRGQPATPHYLNPAGAFCVGAEIGWRHVEVCLVGLGNQVLGRYRRAYDFPDAEQVFDEVAVHARQLIEDLSAAERKRLTGLGLAVPATLANPPERVVPGTQHRARWMETMITATAERVTGLSASTYVDGHAACWAQRSAYPPPRPLSFLFILLDTCMAGGIVAENRLWEGVTGASGNLGEMLVIDRNGQPCLAHELASIKVLERRLAAAGLGLDTVTGSDISPVAAATVTEWVADAADALAQTIVNSSRVLEFEAAVIESDLPPALTARIVDETQAQVSRFVLPGPPAPPILAGHLGRSGAAQGAALLRMHRLFFSRELAHMAG